MWNDYYDWDGPATGQVLLNLVKQGLLQTKRPIPDPAPVFSEYEMVHIAAMCIDVIRLSKCDAPGGSYVVVGNNLQVPTCVQVGIDDGYRAEPWTCRPILDNGYSKDQVGTAC